MAPFAGGESDIVRLTRGEERQGERIIGSSDQDKRVCVEGGRGILCLEVSWRPRRLRRAEVATRQHVSPAAGSLGRSALCFDLFPLYFRVPFSYSRRNRVS